MNDIDRPGIDRILWGLCWAGIICWFVISANDIHRWRVWGDFDSAFALSAQLLGNTGPRPIWLYAVALPFVVGNFGCLVQLLRGKRRSILPVFTVTSLAIAVMPLLAGQWVLYRLVLADVFTALGFSIGGAIVLILYLRLDTHSHASYEHGS